MAISGTANTLMGELAGATAQKIVKLIAFRQLLEQSSHFRVRVIAYAEFQDRMNPGCGQSRQARRRFSVHPPS